MTRISNDVTQETFMTSERQSMAAAVAGAMCFAGDAKESCLSNAKSKFGVN